MSRLETLMWQQHVVTIRAETLKLKARVTFVTVSDEKVAFQIEQFVWLSETLSDGTMRICYNRKVPTAGVSRVKLKKTDGNLATFSGKDLKLVVNKKFHKLIEE